MMKKFSLSGVVLLCLTANPGIGWAQDSTPTVPAEAAVEPDPFQTWLTDFRIEANAAGITDETLDLALADVKVIKRVVTRDRAQAEFTETYAQYLAKRVSEWRVRKGREQRVEQDEALRAVAQEYGVQPRFIAAIWGVETNYGTVDLTYSVFDALATLAYDPRRSTRFKKELIAALRIVQDGHATMNMMKGSWAGAMGQNQFMPTSYLQYAEDFHNDGHRDIWDNHHDVFASIANYLRDQGWQSGQTWGRPVTLPDGGAGDHSSTVAPEGQCGRYKSLGPWRPLSVWQELGVRRLNGDDLPTRNLPAALIAAEDGSGSWLVYRNFCSVMRYNPAFRYALSVGLLADAIEPTQ